MANYKNQHYVPQIYLKGFMDTDIDLGKDANLYRLNKETGIIDKKGIKNICTENYYYSYIDDNGQYNHNIEKMFSQFETDFKKIKFKATCIRDAYFRNDENIWFSRHEERMLIRFIIFQLLRVPAKIEPFIELMSNGFKQMNQTEGIVQSEQQILNDIRKLGVAHMFSADDKNYKLLEFLINSKNKFLTFTGKNEENSFIITDNPVLITNTVERNALINRKTEITMTINKNIAISFYEYGNTRKYNLIDSENISRINNSFYMNATRYCFSGNEKNLRNLLLTRL
jgi:hypothetical protein